MLDRQLQPDHRADGVLQGEVERAADDVRVVIVGNPANTNGLIAASNAPDIPKTRFSAMTRLDQNRAYAQLANKAGVPVTDVSQVTIWGNHSATQYPDAENARIKGRQSRSWSGSSAAAQRCVTADP